MLVFLLSGYSAHAGDENCPRVQIAEADLGSPSPFWETPKLHKEGGKRCVTRMQIVLVRGLLLSTYAILHAIWTPSPFLHVIRNRNV